MSTQTRDPGERESSWKHVTGSKASQLVVDQIRERFFAGMKPGEWLGSETELAAQFGVSRSTMRDAVRTLEAYGIVEVRVGAAGGIRVAQANPAHFAESLAVQISLSGVSWAMISEAMVYIEPQIASLAAIRRTPAQLDDLRQIIEDHRTYRADPPRLLERSTAFHLAIGEASANEALYVALKALRLTEGRQMRPYPGAMAEADRITRQHRMIFRAIERQDGDAAYEAMRRHDEHIVTTAGDARTPRQQ